jgi:hypothetical protein
MGSKAERSSSEVSIGQNNKTKARKSNKTDNLLAPNKLLDEDAALKGFTKLCQDLWTKLNTSEESTPTNKYSKIESKTPAQPKSNKKGKSNKSKQSDNATANSIRGNSEVKNLAPMKGSTVEITKNTNQPNNLFDAPSPMDDVNFDLPMNAAESNAIKAKNKHGLRNLTKDITHSLKVRKKVGWMNNE